LTPIHCFRCNELLVTYDESAHGEFYLGEIGHTCKDGAYAVTKMNAWFKDGKQVIRYEPDRKKKERERDELIMKGESPIPYYLE